MFHRIIYGDWHYIVPILSFILTAAVFGWAIVRAIRIPKEEGDRLASLPLDDGDPPSTAAAAIASGNDQSDPEDQNHGIQ